MSKKKTLFESDNESENEDATLKINSEYATNYERWRKLEEKQKLIARYGEDAASKGSDSSESEEEDEEGEFDTPDMDKGFLRALSALKSKDPRIYDKGVSFSTSYQGPRKLEKKEKEKPMYLRDYDRHIILEKEGRYSDEEEDEENPVEKNPTYVSEQKEIKEAFKNILNDSDDEAEEDLLKVREKSMTEKQKEEADYREWLKNPDREDIPLDNNLAKDLKGLRKVWAEESLPEDEKFLRDYLLNQRYREKDDEEFPTYNDIVGDEPNLSEDEELVEQQDLFEHKYNFRFEEPDPDFIKSYPRTMKDTVRKKDTRRKDKREEVKSRKEREKAEKREELNRLKELKREEIMERLNKIKDVSGNDRLGLDDKDLEEDFDPEAYDKRMEALYGNDYYEGDEAEDAEKPVFEYDEEIDGDMVNWDNWEPSNDEDVDQEEGGPKKKKKKSKPQEPEANEELIMDCDYDPTSAAYEAAMAAQRKKGKRKKKSVFAKAVDKKKPVFDPVEKEFEEYFDEYYQLDYEDLIGDLPCRFKYRKVVPNDFGLSTEEILAAKDKELNKWVSLKKSIQYRKEEDERYDVHAYRERAKNERLKAKLLPSVYKDEEAEEGETEETKSQKKRKKKKNGSLPQVDPVSPPKNGQIPPQGEVEETKSQKKRKKKKNGSVNEVGSVSPPKNGQIPPPETTPVSPAPNKKPKKRKLEETEDAGNPAKKQKTEPAEVVTQPTPGKKLKLKKKEKKALKKKERKQKKAKNFAKQDPAGPKMSDARLRAFGLNPKKARNRWKYKGEGLKPF